MTFWASSASASASPRNTPSSHAIVPTPLPARTRVIVNSGHSFDWRVQRLMAVVRAAARTCVWIWTRVTENEQCRRVLGQVAALGARGALHFTDDQGPTVRSSERPASSRDHWAMGRPPGHTGCQVGAPLLVRV